MFIRHARLVARCQGCLDETCDDEETVRVWTRTPQDGLFVRVRRGNHPTRDAMTDKAIELVVKHSAKLIEADDVTAHGLRATFITLALEADAPLHKVQYAVGHSDPRTTEQYQKRKHPFYNVL